MFGLGRKDKAGRQVRLEHRGRNLRVSRTGGIAARAERRLGPVNAAVNTATGVRLSARVAKGTHIALQRGRFRLQGRWKAGPFGFNLSKSGVSASVKTSTGTLNFLRPRYSSFKLAGVQVRGKNAMYLQLATLALAGAVLLVMIAVRLVVFAGWLIYIAAAFLSDLALGFARGARHGTEQPSSDGAPVERP